jgi:hypothetical protein
VTFTSQTRPPMRKGAPRYTKPKLSVIQQKYGHESQIGAQSQVGLTPIWAQVIREKRISEWLSDTWASCCYVIAYFDIHRQEQRDPIWAQVSPCAKAPRQEVRGFLQPKSVIDLVHAVLKNILKLCRVPPVRRTEMVRTAFK